MTNQHDFVPLPDTPDQCARTGCGSFWNNYVAHRVFTDAAGIPARPSIVNAVEQVTEVARPVTMPPTPELDKMSSFKHESQPIGEFLEWLFSNDFHIAKYKDGVTTWGPDENGEPVGSTGMLQVTKSIEQWLAEYLEIDLKIVEEERVAILKYIRTHNASTSDSDD